MNELDCKKIFEMLSQYLDRELPAETCAELERHIQDCAPCIEFVEILKKSIRVCRQYESAEQPPELAETVKQSLQKAYRKMLDSRGDGASDPGPKAF